MFVEVVKGLAKCLKWFVNSTDRSTDPQKIGFASRYKGLGVITMATERKL